jgi:hypothetical protein
VCCVEVVVTVERLCDIWVERDLLARMGRMRVTDDRPRAHWSPTIQ